MSHDPRSLVRRARRKLDQGDPAGAMALARRGMGAASVSADILDVYARAAAAAGQYGAAIEAMEQLIRAAGAELQRVLFYGNLLLRARRWKEAAGVFRQVVKERPHDSVAWLGLGHGLLGGGAPEEAANCYRRVLEREPSHFAARLSLAKCRLLTGEAVAALDLLEPLREEHPAEPDLERCYGEALFRAGRFSAAARVLEPEYRESRNFEVGFVLAAALAWTERAEEAAVLIEELLGSAPEDPELRIMQARVLMVRGRVPEAGRIVQRVLEREPERVNAWQLWGELADAPLEAPKLEALLALLAEAESWPNRTLLADLYFVLARHHELAGDPDAEFRALSRGNEIKAALHPFDPQSHQERITRIRRSYDAGRLRQLQTPEDSSDVAHVFLLCPPRSGSTLLEQALARHSNFQAGGERDFAEEAWQALYGLESSLGDPACHEKLEPGTVQEFKRQYQLVMKEAGLDPHRPMVHKGINGHKFAGLLAVTFPRASFVELRRDPLDVAFGCYRKNFANQPFSRTFEGCAGELALFQENMRWWRAQMGPRVYGLDYEALVSSFEEELGRLLAWLGLAWEDACLDFSRAGVVATASSQQVREGLSRQGVGRARRYEKHLAPLHQALREAGVSSP